MAEAERPAEESKKEKRARLGHALGASLEVQDLEQLSGQVGISIFQADDSQEYIAFTDKFKPKLTTDDCYTPPEIFAVILDYCRFRYGIRDDDIVRPFFPGGDYTDMSQYSMGCVVLDNPPFSILRQIVSFYVAHRIRFFLFAPSLTSLSNIRGVTAVIPDAEIVYHNGAVVRTSFLTNLSPAVAVETAPELGRLINDAVKKLAKKDKADLPKYKYPDNIVTAAFCQKLAHGGQDFRVLWNECVFIRQLDAQKKIKKSIFGGGLLVGTDAAAAAAAAAVGKNEIPFLLSEREKRTVALIDSRLKNLSNEEITGGAGFDF